MRTWDIEFVENVTLLVAFIQKSSDCGPYSAPCWRTGARLVNMSLHHGRPGDTVWEYTFPVSHWLHREVHDAEYLPGREEVLIMDMDQERVFAVSIHNNSITWEWRAADHYPAPADPTKQDWLHMNDVDVIDRDTYLVNVPRRGEMLKLKRGAGVVDVIDPPQLRFDTHNPQWLGPGALLIADSGNDRVLELHETAPGRWETAWSVASADGPLEWPRDADRLPNGNTLIVDTGNDRLLEVDQDGRVVWSRAVDRHGYDAEWKGREYPAGPPVNRAETGAAADLTVTMPSSRVPVLSFLHDVARYHLPLPRWLEEEHLLLLMIDAVALVAVGSRTRRKQGAVPASRPSHEAGQSDRAYPSR